MFVCCMILNQEVTFMSYRLQRIHYALVLKQAPEGVGGGGRTTPRTVVTPTHRTWNTPVAVELLVRGDVVLALAVFC